MVNLRTEFYTVHGEVFVERQWQRPDGSWETFKRGSAHSCDEAQRVAERLKKADA